MTVSLHACERFKTRQNIKNRREMLRKAILAYQRGKLLVGENNQPGTCCYEFDGYRYIFSFEQVLITLYSARKTSHIKRRRAINEQRCSESVSELGNYLYEDQLED